MTPKQHARDRARIRAKLMSAGFILSEVREIFDTRAQDETGPQSWDSYTAQLQAMDDVLDGLDSLIGDYTDED
jgi:hypothetical protein